MPAQTLNPASLMDNLLTFPWVKTFIPVFLLLLAWEWWSDRRRSRPLYRTGDALSSLSCGIFSQLTGVLLAGAISAAYIFVETRWGLIEFRGRSNGEKLAAAVLIFLLGDLAYYWFHRLAHQVNIGWAGHVVHHQSEEYNLSTALRQSSTQWMFELWFFLPIALLGVPFEWHASLFGLNLVYQFFIHTRTVGKLHPLVELIMNTPSHHRVHHGRNPEYLDRNHAGTLIIWDRMFGTFQEERNEPVYGIVHPLRTYNPLDAQLRYYLDLWRQMRELDGPVNKLKLWFKPPGWHPDRPDPRAGLPPIDPQQVPEFDPHPKPSQRRLSQVLFMIGLLAAVAVIFAPGQPVGFLALWMVLAFAGLTVSGMLWGVGKD